MADTTDTDPHAGYPDWFDKTLHHAGGGGIFETRTGVLLGDDGEPASAAVRAERATDAGVVAAELAAPPKTRRDTRAIIEGAAVAAADKE